MNLWVSHGNASKQALLAIGCALVGLLLMFGFRGFRSMGSDALAGFLLGVLLLVVGVFTTLAGKQTVVVDPKKRCITIEDYGRFYNKRRVILFNDIAVVHVSYQGQASNRTVWYFLSLKLRNGERYPLFAPGRFYAGASNEAVVLGWQQRLQNYIDA